MKRLWLGFILLLLLQSCLLIQVMKRLWLGFILLLLLQSCLLIQPGDVEPIKIGTDMVRDEVYVALRDAFPEIIEDRFIVHKPYYYLPSSDELKWIVSMSALSYARRSDPDRNCIDFTEIFTGFYQQQLVMGIDFTEIFSAFCHQQFYMIAVGELYAGSHAINVCLTADKGVVLIEPQTGEIWDLGERGIQPANFLRM